MLNQQLTEFIQSWASDCFSSVVGSEMIQIQKTRKEFDGDVTIVAFPLLRISKQSPEQTASSLGGFLKQKCSLVTDFNVVKGFLNLSISDAYWFSTFETIAENKRYGYAEPNSGRTVMVEYSSPNTNKPLHLGHIRNILLGYAVSEILKATGAKVVKTQIINDRGIHICKSMLAWQKWSGGETPESAGLKGDKLVGNYYVEFDKHYKEEITALVSNGTDKEVASKEAPLIKEAQVMLQKWEAGDHDVIELWSKMNGWVYAGFDDTYERMGVDFDKLYYESETFKIGKELVKEGVEKGVFFEKEDGSVWVDLTEDGLDQKLLLRADGTTVYMTQDMGTAKIRYENYPDLKQLVYTVANEQDYHFKVLFLILNKLGFEWAKECYHLSYGMVELPSGRMKSREGTVVDADELMESVVQTAKEMTMELGKLEGRSEEEKSLLYETIGMGALKYYLLKVDPKKNMMYDPDESVELNGNTAPFVQYAHARICSILRRSSDIDTSTIKVIVKLEDAEREVIKLLVDFPKILKEAADNFSPATLANYIYEMVKTYNYFYQSVPVLKVDDENLKKFRIKLSAIVGRTIKESMSLLGISVPERM